MQWRRSNRLNDTKRRRYLPLSRLERLGRGLLAALVSAVLVVSVWKGREIVHHEGWVMLRHVRVDGELRRVDPDHVVQLLGLTAGRSLLFLDLESLRHALERHPWIKSVRLTRDFPQTLAVQVIEERPVAIAATPRYYYVNDVGQLFKLVEKGDDMDFPLLVPPANPEGSMVGKFSKKVVHEMIDFLNKYDQTRFAKEYGVSEVLWRPHGFTFFTTRGGLQVEVGAQDIDGQLWKLDRYYPDIMVQSAQGGALNLQLKGKIIANLKPF